ncbi:hypothetical protein PCE1_002464 [Barthelona sp. PCE]
MEDWTEAFISRQNKRKEEKFSHPKKLLHTEEHAVVSYYCHQLIEWVNDESFIKSALNAQWASVPETPMLKPSTIYRCLSLFRRFYVLHSVATYPPEVLIIVCLILGAKLEEQRIFSSHRLFSSDMFIKHNVPIESFCFYEMRVLETLNFHITSIHPFISLYSYISDLYAGQYIDHSAAEYAYAKGCDWIQRSVTNDFAFIQDYSLLSISALYHSIEDENIVEDYKSFLLDQIEEEERKIEVNRIIYRLRQLDFSKRSFSGNVAEYQDRLLLYHDRKYDWRYSEHDDFIKEKEKGHINNLDEEIIIKPAVENLKALTGYSEEESQILTQSQ